MDPERLWRHPATGFNHKEAWASATEYVRADLVAAKDAEIERLRAIVAERLSNCHHGRHSKRVRRLSDNEIGITIGDTEYAMPLGEANELVSLICRARHDATSTPEPDHA